MSIRTRILAAAVLAMGLQAHAGVSIPNTFSSGTAASASQVNANFTALATAIDSVSARVSKLENSQNINIGDLLGSYNLMILQTSVSTGSVMVKQIVGNVQLSHARINSTDVYTANLSCDNRHEETVMPNSNYGKTDLNTGIMDIAGFNTAVNNSCSGVFSVSSLNWTFDTNTRKVNFTGTNVELMPVGPGMLIGRDYVQGDTPASGSTPRMIEMSNAILVLVRKQ